MKVLKHIGGIDEAGRGPLAGPVVAAVVIRNELKNIPGINDSKVLNPQKRQELYNEIIKKWAYGIGLSSHQEVDQLGIKKATNLAMQRAINRISLPLRKVMVDGNDKFTFDIKSIDVIKGDNRVESIAAASILAKVTRDHIMDLSSKLFPLYNFQKHKGYGTAGHLKVLAAQGPCPWHRKSYLKNHHDSSGPT